MSTADLPQPVEPIGPGLLGDGAARPGRYNLALARRAIREGWDIPEEARKLLVDQMQTVMRDGKDGVKVGAAGVLVRADANNLKRAELELKVDERDNPRGEAPSNVHVTVDVRQQVLNDPRYLEYLRAEAAAANGDASPVRANGEPRAVEAGPAPDAPGPSANGHHSGNGRD